MPTERGPATETRLARLGRAEAEPSGEPRGARHERETRHVLIVSYYFPPMGGVPVRRVLRFLEHLPSFGWRCSVLTADRPYDPFHPTSEQGLEHLPPVERVLRAPAHAAFERLVVLGYRSLASLLRRARPSGASSSRGDVEGGDFRRLLYDTVFFPDPKCRWAAGALREFTELARSDPPNLVLATGYPWSAFLLGDRVARRIGAPVLLDFRDAWTTNPRPLWSGSRHVALEKKLVTRSAAVVTATEGIRDALHERHPELEGACPILNGFDAPAVTPPHESLEDPEHFLLVYTGTFNDALPPSSYDVSPYFLLQAVRRLPAEARRALRIRLVGRVPESYRRWIAERGLLDVVEIRGSLPHSEALRHQRAADALLLVIYDAPGASGVLTGKLVEYAGSGRPVLALAPEGEAAGWIRSRRLGWVEPPRDTRLIAKRLESLVRDWRAGSYVRNHPPVEELSAATQIRRLAGIMDDVLEKHAASEQRTARLGGRSLGAPATAPRACRAARER